jgi:hypothetical protein
MHSVHKNMKACSLVFKYEREEPSREDHRSISRSLLYSHPHVNSRFLVRRSRFLAQCKNSVVPNKGIASETWGRVSATRFRNTVSDSKMVTPETVVAHLCSMIRFRWRSFASGVDGRVVTSASSTWKTRSSIGTLLSRPPIDEKSTEAEFVPHCRTEDLSAQGKKGNSIGFSIVSRASFATTPRPGGIVDGVSPWCLLAVLPDMMFSR